MSAQTKEYAEGQRAIARYLMRQIADQVTLGNLQQAETINMTLVLLRNEFPPIGRECEGEPE